MPKTPGVPKNHFVYCPESANKDTVNYFSHHNYAKTPLNKDAMTFWNALNSVPKGGNMVFLSHGDAERGPLLVAGNDGNDFMSTEEIGVLGARLKDKNAKLYLLSCHTGKTGSKEEPTFCDKLAATQAKFVAPVGFANLKGNPGSFAVTSVEGKTTSSVEGDTILVEGKSVGWAGTDAPGGRAARALELPRDESSNKKKG